MVLYRVAEYGPKVRKKQFHMNTHTHTETYKYMQNSLANK